MKAPSGDCLPAHGTTKVTQMLVLNNPKKVGLTNEHVLLTVFSQERDAVSQNTAPTLVSVIIIHAFNLKSCFCLLGEPEDEDPCVLPQSRISFSRHSPS